MSTHAAPPRWFVGTVILLAVMGLAARLATLSGAPDNDDGPLFIRGVQRFAVAEGRPHWPGYPIYIAAGKLATAFVGNPALGLQLVAALAGAATSVLVAWTVFRWAASLGLPLDRSARAGLAATLLWLLVPISWVTGSQIISDPLGLLCGLGILVLGLAGESRGTRGPWIVAALLGGLLPGIRLVNVSMLGPLAWKAWSARRERWGRWPASVVLAAALAAGAVPWLAGLAITDAAGYVEAGRAHLRGHFTNFGESLWTDRHPGLRPWTALHTVFVYGLGAGGPGRGWTRVLVGAAWALSVSAALRLRPWRGPVFRLILVWAVPNLVHVFVAHDVAYPRYMMTADLLVVLVAALAAADQGRAARLAIAATVVSVAAVTVPIAIHQGRQPPVEYQAAAYLARRAPGAIVLMTRPDILLSMYVAEFPGHISPVMMPGWDVTSWRLNGDGRGRRVYTTAIPPEDAEAWVPVAHFCRDPMIEPLIASELWLFTVAAAGAETPLPACGEER